jgi:hypothetical protein
LVLGEWLIVDGKGGVRSSGFGEDGEWLMVDGKVEG